MDLKIMRVHSRFGHVRHWGSIMFLSFRPPWPLGIPWLRRRWVIFFASFARSSRPSRLRALTAEIAKDSRSSQRKANPEGAGGNARASRLREKPLERRHSPADCFLSLQKHLAISTWHLDNRGS